MPLTPWQIRLIQWGALTASELAAQYLTTQRETVSDLFEGRRAVMTFRRVSKGAVEEDVAQCSLALINYTDGTPDSTWTDPDFVVGEGALDGLWAALKVFYPSTIELGQIRWYRFGKSVTTPNPAVRIIERDVPGTAASDELPPQVAASVTFKTGLRKHWGRMYLPPPSVASISEGNLTTAFVDSVADTFETWLSNLSTNDLRPVVWSPTKSAALAIQTVQVDDLVDVIRSRRFNAPTVRERRPA